MVYPITAHCLTHQHDEEGGFVIEATTIQDPIAFATTVGDEDGPFWGPRLVEAVRRFRYWVGFLAMANDDNNSTVSIGDDGQERIDVDFQPVERERIDACLRFSRDVLEAAGATQTCWTGLVSTHVQGSCRMGDDPERSVVDRNGESHEVKRLFVGDGSLVPRTLSVNPSLTIMALATRLADHLDADASGYLGARPPRGRHESGAAQRVPPPARAGRAAGPRADGGAERRREDRRRRCLPDRSARDRRAHGAGRGAAAARARPRECRVGARRRRRRHGGGGGRSGSPLPAVQLRAVRALPSRRRGLLRSSSVHRPDAGRRLRGLRRRRRALAAPAAGGRRAGGGGAPRGRGHHRLPRRQEAGAPPRRREHDGRDRRRRRRPHRSPARQGARVGWTGHRHRHGRAPPPPRAGARRGRGARRGDGRRGRGPGADERGRRRRRVRLRGHGRDAFARARGARAARPVLDRRLRRDDHAPVGRLRLRRDCRSRGTSSATGSTSGSSCSCTGAAR